KIIAIGDDYLQGSQSYDLPSINVEKISHDEYKINFYDTYVNTLNIDHIEHIDYFVVINNVRLYYVGTTYESNVLTSFFARGDMTEHFEWITMNQLLICMLLIIAVLFIINIFEVKIEQTIEDWRKKMIIYELTHIYLTLRDIYKIKKYDLEKLILEINETERVIEIFIYRNQEQYNSNERIVLSKISKRELEILGLRQLAQFLKEVVADITDSDIEKKERELDAIIVNLLEQLYKKGVKL
ncbi:MAG: hypothetical protein K6G88_06995, partial [Lachnospiraceae bacterium]|nr:hypothetical protein [Lachnospiraceae bacterium]